jgi:hypothetical protein
MEEMTFKSFHQILSPDGKIIGMFVVTDKGSYLYDDENEQMILYPSRSEK